MRKTYFFMAFWALAFGISGCGDITCKPGSYCNDSNTRMVCKSNGELNFANCSTGCDFNTGKCKYNPGLETVDCQDNTYKCDVVAGRDVSHQYCGGNWLNYTPCKNGCDATTGRCKDDENQPGTSTCTSGEYQCDANVSYVCLNGEWSIVDTCANGCNTSTGKCNANNGGNDNSGGGNNSSTPECTSGSYKCVDDISYYCDYGWWGTYDYCSNGCNTFTGKCNVVEDGMAAECTSGSYKCENDTSYYCNYGWWAVEEYCEYGCDNKTAKCIDLCEPGGTQYCKKTCNYLGTEGYYYANGKVNTVYCSNYDCTTENDKVECRSQMTSGTSETCTKATYASYCTADRSEGYYCGSQGTVVKKLCPDYDCYNDAGYIGCGTPSGGSGSSCIQTETTEMSCYDNVDNDCDGFTDGNDYDCLEPCPMMEGIPCEQCLNVCDWLDGYYCNTRVGIMVKKTCANSCTVSGNRIECN